MNNIDEKQLYWIAGILEGEGSFMKGVPSAPHIPKVAIQTTDEDVLQRLSDLLGVTYSKVKQREEGIEKGWKQVYYLQVSGLTAVKLMEILYPHMSNRRKQQIKQACESYDVKPRSSPCKKLSENTVNEIRVRLSNGDKQSLLSKEYNVAGSTISRIASNKFWKGEKIKYIPKLVD